jgi:hypothetical protein
MGCQETTGLGGQRKELAQWAERIAGPLSFLKEMAGRQKSCAQEYETAENSLCLDSSPLGHSATVQQWRIIRVFCCLVRVPTPVIPNSRQESTLRDFGPDPENDKTVHGVWLGS